MHPTIEVSSSSSSDGYGLLRTYVSSTRLNAQHYLWKEAVGHNIHPRIPIKNESDVRIADVGTGTGIWLTDTHREFPLAQIDGFDISLAQCPPQEWLPKNTSIRNLDILSPLPDDLVGVYDIVHVRLFLVVVQNNDPIPTLRNLLNMLKPGGYLQWAEHNLSTMSVTVTAAERKSSAMQEMLHIIQTCGFGSWIPRLSETFREQGLLEAQADKYPIAPDTRLFWTQMQFNSTEEFSIVALDNSSPEARGPQCRKVIKEAVEESREGVALNFILEVTVGRKSL